MIPKIAIIGRANVGKSTLFNRLVERQKALVSKIPGTTRDRNEADCLWRGKIIRIIDTGGMDVDWKNEIEQKIVAQARKAMDEADVILFLVDARAGLMPLDETLAKELAKSTKPVIPVVNKIDGVKKLPEWKWPLSDPCAISAAKGNGVGDLLDEIYETLKKLKKHPADITEVTSSHIAVIGKPNVGKSSFINKVLGEERFIVSGTAHTTREPNDTEVEVGGKKYVLIDTAGIRKLAKVKKARTLETASVRRSLDTLKKADVALFVIDISKPITAQDKILAGLIIDARVGTVIVANKWDLIEDKETNINQKFNKKIHNTFPYFTWAPIIYTSAKSGQRVKKVFELVDEVQQARYKEISQEELDTFLARAMRKQKPLRGKGAGFPKIVGFSQIGIAPPRFQLVVKGKYTEALNKAYVRYLENSLREHFKLIGTPVKISVRASKKV